MSEKQHLEDIEKLPGKHSSSGGGACLCRHVPKWEKNNFCSHRWQAYERALADSGRYNWPRYESLARPGTTIQTAASNDKKGNLFPPWYSEEIAAPSKLQKNGEDAGNWDLDHGDNFQSKCYRPYWHEANHIIPNSTLQKAIAEIARDMHSPHRVRLVVRGRLLEARYNLNHQDNMILLPMDSAVARALRLPRHRQTAFLRSHKAYSDNVLKELMLIFRTLQGQLRKHSKPKPDYGDFKDSLVSFSKQLYGQIIAAGEADGAGSLDEMREERFKQKQPEPSATGEKSGMDASDF